MTMNLGDLEEVEGEENGNNGVRSLNVRFSIYLANV